MARKAKRYYGEEAEVLSARELMAMRASWDDVIAKMLATGEGIVAAPAGVRAELVD